MARDLLGALPKFPLNFRASVTREYRFLNHRIQSPAAALESQHFGNVKLVRALASWSDLVRHPTANGQLVNTVHGALKAYDLPDLVSVLPKDKVTIVDALDAKALAANPYRGK